MLSHEYDIMRMVEDDHWWYRALHGLVSADLRTTLAGRQNPRILDAGCGTGGLMNHLIASMPGWNLTGLDAFPEAVDHVRSRGFKNIIHASVENIPVEKDSFDAVTSLDVLYHHNVNNRTAMREFHRVLKPGGMLVLNLPAFASLAGSHDVAVSGVRRYTSAGVHSLAAEAGFKIKRLHYWNAWLFLPVLIWRQLSRRRKSMGASTKSDLQMTPAWLNRCLNLLVRMDMIVCRVLRLPFGTSVYALAIKQTQSDADE